MALLSMPALIYAVNHLLFRAYKVRQSPEEGDDDDDDDQKGRKKGKGGAQRDNNIRQTYPDNEGPGRTVQITIR
jgi:hypothetical protein